MKAPADIHALLARRYARQCGDWLHGGDFPLTLPLGVPTETFARQHGEAVRAWIHDWQTWSGGGEISWCERRWRTLGTQRLPERLTLPDAAAVARLLGEDARWQRAQSRYHALSARWPALAVALCKHYDTLADWPDADYHILGALLAWLVAHPQSHYYPRQIPLAGLSSKWLERRKALITTLLAAIHGDGENHDFYTRCGLRPPAATLRLRLLDPALRARVGGLGDLTAPVEQLAALPVAPRHVYIVENLQTGLAFQALADSLVIMGLGYAVDALAALPWLHTARCHYWGDLDTHGFAILSRARGHLPHLESLLMDEATLLAHRPQWGEESTPHPAAELPRLTDAEQALYHALKTQRYAQNLRLEQERIAWDSAWAAITACRAA